MALYCLLDKIRNNSAWHTQPPGKLVLACLPSPLPPHPHPLMGLIHLPGLWYSSPCCNFVLCLGLSLTRPSGPSRSNSASCSLGCFSWWPCFVQGFLLPCSRFFYISYYWYCSPLFKYHPDTIAHCTSSSLRLGLLMLCASPVQCLAPVDGKCWKDG